MMWAREPRAGDPAPGVLCLAATVALLALGPVRSVDAANGRGRRAQEALRAAVVIRCGNGFGTGVLVGDGGLILTVNHVVREAAPIRALLAGEPTVAAAVLARDPKLDLALLRLGGRLPDGRPGAPLGSVLAVSAGDELLSVGNPRDLNFTLRRGIASFVGRRFGAVRYLQSDLPAEPGSSGSPIFDDSGRLVALISFIVRDGERLAFAIPVDYAVESFAALRSIARLSLEERMRFERWRRELAEVPLGSLR